MTQSELQMELLTFDEMIAFEESKAAAAAATAASLKHERMRLLLDYNKAVEASLRDARRAQADEAAAKRAETAAEQPE